jgi:hypothetical protein
MRRMKIHCVLAAALATFSTAGLGVGAASAQNMPIVCPEGQVQVNTYLCDPVTLQCVLVSSRCE